jgi:flagellar basal-body rod modification protein FlgD
MPDAITAAGIGNQAQKTTNQAVTLGNDFADFLSLLTTQLQNQDPLAPLDSNEFTNQLVRFSQVEQAINTNSKLDNLVALQLSNAATGALGYVGLDVSYISAEISHDGENPNEINYSLASNASVSKLNIYDENSAIVFSGEAETGAGVHQFTWDGKDISGNLVPEGTYAVTIDAFDVNDNKIETTTVVNGRVRGIEQQNGEVFVLVGERAVPITSILNASEPEEPVEEETAQNGDGTGNDTTV